MYFLKLFSISACFLLVSLKPSFAQDSILVYISGYVFDVTGKPIPNAKLEIPKLGISQNVDATGGTLISKKVLSSLPVIHFAKETVVFSRPKPTSEGLYFSVQGKNQNVSIAAFTLTGKQIACMHSGNLAPGSYKINFLKSSQTYVLRAQIGDQISTYKISSCGTRAIINSGNSVNSGNFQVSPIHKKAMIFDNITASASNYISESRPIDSTDGAHYFYLRQVGTTTGKHLDISFNFNEILEPMPSLLTAVWLTDTLNTRLQTLFVSQWLSDEGYRRQGICPTWLGPDSTYWATQRTTNSSFVDAVTHATPDLGKNAINFIINPSLTKVKCCIETHIDGPSNMLYSGVLDLTKDSSNVLPIKTYIPSQAVDIDVLSNVKFIVHK